jgi:hypothetical protein
VRSPEVLLDEPGHSWRGIDAAAGDGTPGRVTRHHHKLLQQVQQFFKSWPPEVATMHFVRLNLQEHAK